MRCRGVYWKMRLDALAKPIVARPSAEMLGDAAVMVVVVVVVGMMARRCVGALRRVDSLILMHNNTLSVQSGLRARRCSWRVAGAVWRESLR